MGGVAARASAGAGEGRVDPATLMILRALAGERGKVEIGGRLYSFSCVTTFHLRDEESGFLYACADSVSLLKRIVSLLRDSRERRQRRLFSSSAAG